MECLRPPKMQSLFECVRIVLVEPQHPGNIGATARAMKNMGLSKMVLVAPRRYPHPDASALAAGAVDVLSGARVYPTLYSAIADCPRVVGSTARNRYLSQPVYPPREWTRRMQAKPISGDIAILFGRERVGLTNAELDFCHELIAIPASQTYPSLNLAQAVQVVCYELRLAASEAIQNLAVVPARRTVSQGEMERFYAHLEEALVSTGFLDEANPRLLMRRLRRLFGRLDPDANEMNILRGILTSVLDSRRTKGG